MNTERMNELIDEYRKIQPSLSIGQDCDAIDKAIRVAAIDYLKHHPEAIDELDGMDTGFIHFFGHLMLGIGRLDSLQ